MVAVSDFSGLVSSACALASAAAIAPMVSLDRCIARLHGAQEIKTDRKLNGGDRDVQTAGDTGRVNGHSTSPAITTNGSRRKPLPRPSKPVLAAAASAALRDQLLAEMANTTGAEELSGWAQRSLPAKNKLTGADAQLVERAFDSKLNALPGDQEPATEPAILNLTRSDAAALSATAR